MLILDSQFWSLCCKGLSNSIICICGCHSYSLYLPSQWFGSGIILFGTFALCILVSLPKPKTLLCKHRFISIKSISWNLETQCSLLYMIINSPWLNPTLTTLFDNHLLLSFGQSNQVSIRCDHRPYHELNWEMMIWLTNLSVSIWSSTYKLIAYSTTHAVSSLSIVIERLSTYGIRSS